MSDMSIEKVKRTTLKDKETWRYVGMFDRHPDWTVKHWREQQEKYSGAENPYITCPCCGKPFGDNEYPYMGAFKVPVPVGNYRFRIICKKCAYRISDKVTEADGKIVVVREPKGKEEFSYTLLEKTDKPEFNFLVQVISKPEEYWLYEKFESAYTRMMTLVRSAQMPVHILEPEMCADGEWRMYRSFKADPSGTEYMSNHGEWLLHCKFYTDAGVWKNYSRKGVR